MPDVLTDEVAVLLKLLSEFELQHGLNDLNSKLFDCN
jgi:hypothetical protein